MQVDALTLAAVADDFSSLLTGTRVEDAIQPTPHAIALLCYGNGQRHWLVASAHPRYAGIHLSAGRPRKITAEPPPFVMLLRKHLEGTRIAQIRQPRWERVLEIGFTTGPASAPAAWLIIEAMGRLSNIVLRNADGVILGALHTVSASVNRYRTIAPNVPYRYPPPQARTLRGETVARLDPESITAQELREAALDAMGEISGQKGSGSLIGLLSSQVLGLGRDLSAEVVWRAVGERDTPVRESLPWDALAATMRALAGLMVTHAWEPTLIYQDDDSSPSGFAVYRPERFPSARLVPQPGVSAMLTAYFHDAEWRDAIENAKSGLRRQLHTAAERSERKAEALNAELSALDEAKRLRLEADLLLAFQAEVSRGATTFTTDNPFAEGDQPQRMTMTIDPRLSAVDNANKRYDRYHKLQRAAVKIPEQIEANRVEHARISQLLTDLTLAETPAEVANVREAVAASSVLHGEREIGKDRRGKGKDARRAKNAKKAGKGQKKSASPGGAPLRLRMDDGLAVLVGKNSLQNEAVTFREAAPNDLWLHARGVPGAHVIVKAGGRPVPEPALRRAAAIAAYFSQSRGAGTVPVDYTQQRYVRHMKGGGPGMVIYEGERTLYVAPEEPSESQA